MQKLKDAEKKKDYETWKANKEFQKSVQSALNKLNAKLQTIEREYDNVFYSAEAREYRTKTLKPIYRTKTLNKDTKEGA